MKSFLCELFFTCLIAAPGASRLDDLTYGTALYAYYQQDYEQALLQVMVAERRGSTGDDPLRFELARGSFAFQEGMYRFASETFDTVAEDELTDLDRMRLAFHLSREHYRRGDWPGTQAQLARIELGADWRGRQRRHPEVSFMTAEVAMARGDFPAARAALESLPADSEFLAYGLFNLGVALRRAGDSPAAHDAFSRLSELTVTSREGWDLVQRGRLALAVMARQTSDLMDAQAMLGTLPGQGRYRDRALATYGRLATEREDHELAARIWLTLLEGDGWSSSRAMARLALPMSLEKLASTAHALEGYRDAERAFEQRLAALQTLAGRTGDPAWLDALLEVLAVADAQERARELERFDQALGTATWLEWLSAENVHRVVVEWRELNGMAAWLARLPARLTAFEEITRERRRRTAQARGLLTREGLPKRRAELADRVAGLEKSLSDLARTPAQPHDGWMLRLATAGERALVERLSAMRFLVTEHVPAADRVGFEARMERLRGVLFFRIAHHQAGRVRALERRLKESRDLLARIDARMERLARAEDRFAAGVETDFLVLSDRADAVSRRVAAAMLGRREMIARALKRSLEQEVARTRQYLLSTRIAIARATDQLTAAAGGGEGNGS